MVYSYSQSPAVVVLDATPVVSNLVKMQFPVNQNVIGVLLVDHQDNPSSVFDFQYRQRGQAARSYLDVVLDGAVVATRKIDFGRTFLTFSADELAAMWSLLRFMLPEDRENLGRASFNFWVPLSQRIIVTRGYLDFLPDEIIQ